MTEDDFKKHFKFRAGFKALDKKVFEESFESQMRRSIDEIKHRAEMYHIEQYQTANELSAALDAILSGKL